MKIVRNTVTSELGSSQENFDLNLDGRETVLSGGLRLFFKRIDDMSFDVIVGVNNKRVGNHIEENHLVFAADGNRLTETKTHTEREVLAEDRDQAKAPLIRRSTSVFVYLFTG